MKQVQIFIFSVLVLMTNWSQAELLEKDYRELGTIIKKIYAADLDQRTALDGYRHILLVNESESYDPWEIEFNHGSYVGFLDDLNDPAVFRHQVAVFGSLARKPYFGKGGFSFVACHEMGHGFSEGPKKQEGSAVEGEADYYATAVCIERLIQAQYLTEKTHNSELIQLCTQRFPVPTTQNECLIKMQAIEEFKIFLETDFQNKTQTRYPSIEEIQIHSVQEMAQPKFNSEDDYYPSAQCRLESALHGALKVGRPDCWYSSK